MFIKDEIDDYRNDFYKIGIEDENEILTILNYLDSIAEIGYEYYNKHIVN